MTPPDSTNPPHPRSHRVLTLVLNLVLTVSTNPSCPLVPRGSLLTLFQFSQMVLQFYQ